MERLTQTSDNGGVAFTFDLEVTCQPSEMKKILKLAEKLKEYEDLGTVEEIQEMKEKTLPKIPDVEGDGYADGHLVYDTWICPCCGEHYEIDYDEYEYCPKCGQHIDTSHLN